MNQKKYEACFEKDSIIWLVYQVLADRQWHCRKCEYAHTGSGQIAGGSGIQGLQRGNKSRPGIEIDSKNQFCKQCDAKTRQDRWTGRFVAEIPSGSMPPGFKQRAVDLLKSRDVVELTQRPSAQLTVDHKLPRIRWNSNEAATQDDYSSSVTDDDIKARFQLLKSSNGSVSHNHLKSRACENCFRTGKRGTPFGIKFFYAGGSKWEPEDKEAPEGCIGCGWYDFDKWRRELNRMVGRGKKS